mmetsp:Transcript_150475/g.277518  ORF Transcript_150475/g.277518 Transcript_150475/m.277518 type:complete len:268 (-) Transcript_150475:62-865(-)
MALRAGAPIARLLWTMHTVGHRHCGVRMSRFARAGPLPLSRLAVIDKQERELQEKLVKWQVRRNERRAGPAERAAHAAVRAAGAAFAEEALCLKALPLPAAATAQLPPATEQGPGRGSGGGSSSSSSARGPAAWPDSQPHVQRAPPGGQPDIPEGSRSLGDDRRKRSGSSPTDSARCLRVNVEKLDGKNSGSGLQCARAHFSRFGTVDAVVAQGRAGSLEVVFRSVQGLRRALRAHEQPRSVEGLGTVLHAEVANGPHSSGRGSGRH